MSKGQFNQYITPIGDAVFLEGEVGGGGGANYSILSPLEIKSGETNYSIFPIGD